MTLGIVVSRADSASVHVGDHLRDLGEWERIDEGDAFRAPGFELRYFDDWHLELDGVADAFDAAVDAVVFASRHSGDTGPMLTAHFTGNFGRAEHGGADRSLAPACTRAASAVLDALTDHAPDGYDVGMECTHHGPTDPGAPSMFVEVGSSEAEWDDPDAARAAASAILALGGVPARDDRALVAFGGGHYAPRATRIARETDWAVGHVAADWCLDDLGAPDENRDVVDAVFAQSGATRAVVDGEKPALEAVIDDLGYRVVSETWVREVDGVPLDRAAALEAELAPVDDGLRFGDAASANETAREAFTVVDLPNALWADAHSVDPDAALAAAREHSLAYETTENGNRVEGRAAFPDAAAYDAYVDALCDVLAEAYDRVERRDDTVLVEADAFDPALAAERGVPEGPKFGRLANGDAVTVDGREITPGDVTARQRDTYNV
ncbi:D-aminoacyl-tRNA deacylase [Halocalculus aciditolerans]|uniref:D-aminoacyl-tRNA deacylase n=1 Tax=Halocalculus aciditolerans TaxID=1383812 RepID=A0A830FD46_9EURY|nr:D-aminoacyl-tRNA deacylase [Halocalculus aciditolerans]GGL63302.1 D-tyrosyl-tRNA(Tyr) deacylase [Halocalculus aciditolerans]